MLEKGAYYVLERMEGEKQTNWDFNSTLKTWISEMEEKDISGRRNHLM